MNIATHPETIAPPAIFIDHSLRRRNMEDEQIERSVEEIDQVHRSVKKYKRHAECEPPSPDHTSTLDQHAWADLLKRDQSHSQIAEIYNGDGEEDEIHQDTFPTLSTPLMDDANLTGNGKVVVEIQPEEWRHLWRPWKRALVIKTLGRNISYKVLVQRLSDLWSLQGRLEIIDMEDGFYIVRFHNRGDYWHALENGPWVVQGHYLTVKKLRPGFRPSSSQLTSTLVWVRIPRLPIEFFSDQILMRIGNKLGKAVKIDIHTTQVSRAKYARVCVEVDLEKPLISTVMIGDYQLAVEYENLHLICFTCGRYGHRSEDCATRTDGDQHNTHTEPNPTVPEKTNDGFGPWMIARNNNRRRAAPNKQVIEQQHLQTNNEQQVHHKVTGKTGSRFSPIAEIPEEVVEAETDQMTNEMRNIKDSGPPVQFKATTKQQLITTKEKRGKGVPVKDPPRAKIQLPRGPARNNQRQEQAKPSLPHSTRKDTITWQTQDWPLLPQSYPTAMQGTKPLTDITNSKTPTQKTPIQRSGGKDTDMDIYVEEEHQGHNWDQTKHKPPDKESAEMVHDSTESMEDKVTMEADANRPQSPDMDPIKNHLIC